MNIVEGMDMEELFRYAKSKNVGIIPWVIWKTLDDQLDVAMDQFERFFETILSSPLGREYKAVRAFQEWVRGGASSSGTQ